MRPVAAVLSIFRSKLRAKTGTPPLPGGKQESIFLYRNRTKIEKIERRRAGSRICKYLTATGIGAATGSGKPADKQSEMTALYQVSERTYRGRFPPAGGAGRVRMTTLAAVSTQKSAPPGYTAYRLKRCKHSYPVPGVRFLLLISLVRSEARA